MFNRDVYYYDIEKFERFEYTNNVIYEFFKRTLTNDKKLKEYEYIPVIEHTLKLKDVILFENDKIKFTLQDIIYNAYPQLYLDVMTDVNIKDKINFSIGIEDFLSNYEESDFKKVIYKDLNRNEYVELNYENLIKKINETFLYKKINMRYQRKQLNIKECNFINIYDLNVNLPDEEILDYILRLKRQHKKAIREKVNDTSEETIELERINEEEKNRIKRFILFKEKNKIKNKKRKLEYVEESIVEYRTFLKLDTLKNVSKVIIDDKYILDEFKNFKELEKLNSEKIELEERNKNLDYRSYIYNPKKLADILFVYDYMQNEKKKEKDEEKIFIDDKKKDDKKDKKNGKRTSIKDEKKKEKDYTYNNAMIRIQYSILYYRREYIEIIDKDDLENCGLSEADCNRILELKDKLYNLFKFIPDTSKAFNLETFSKIEKEEISEMNKIMNDINSLMNEKSKKLFLPYVPFVSIRTLYKYYEIASFYIEDENYKLLLD
jgi:hypothetical protein